MGLALLAFVVLAWRGVGAFFQWASGPGQSVGDE